MNEARKLILQLLADNKITVDEAECLLKSATSSASEDDCNCHCNCGESFVFSDLYDSADELFSGLAASLGELTKTVKPKVSAVGEKSLADIISAMDSVVEHLKKMQKPSTPPEE